MLISFLNPNIKGIYNAVLSLFNVILNHMLLWLSKATVLESKLYEFKIYLHINIKLNTVLTTVSDLKNWLLIGIILYHILKMQLIKFKNVFYGTCCVIMFDTNMFLCAQLKLVSCFCRWANNETINS